MNSGNSIIANILKNVDWSMPIFGNFTLPFAEALPYIIEDFITTPTFIGNAVIFIAYLMGAEWTSADRYMVSKFFYAVFTAWNLFSLFNFLSL